MSNDNDNDKTKKLLKMKKKIEAGKIEKAQLEGQQKSLGQRLKERFSCKSPTEASAKLTRIDDAIEKKESQLEKGIEKLEESHDW